MMLLISLAIVVSYGASLATTIGWFHLEFWWELGSAGLVMLLGHWQEMKAIGRASWRVVGSVRVTPRRGRASLHEGSRRLPWQIVPGDVVLVRAGARIPADGRVLEGKAEWMSP